MDTYRDRSFDWVSRHDPASRNYPIRALLPPTLPARREWHEGPILNQRAEGACVGHGWMDEATAAPVVVDLAQAELPGTDSKAQPWPHDPQALAFAIYHEAQRIDEWAGESYSGTSVLAGAKVMLRLGLLREYRWAFGIEDVVDTIRGHGPVVLGIPWYDGMYSADGGEVRVAGQVVGGHCILATGYDPARVVNGRPARAMVRLTNSWGTGWGIGGSAWISVDDLAFLLSDGGEACVPVRRSYGRASTLRRWWDKVFGGSLSPQPVPA